MFKLFGFLKSDKGATEAEYVFLIGLIAISLLALFQVVGDNLSDVFSARQQRVLDDNSPPEIGNIDDVRLPITGTYGPINFVVTDTETIPGDLTVTATSSNLVLVPNENITIAGTSSNRTITVNTADTITGKSRITVTVSDGEEQAQERFVVHVPVHAYYLAIGAAGRVVSSVNLDNWRTETSATSQNLHDIAFGSDIFVGVGAGDATIVTSSNGFSWTGPSSPPNGVTLKGISYGEDLFVAVGTNGTIITSPDGTSWTTRTSGTSVHLNDVTYSPRDGQFVAVGDSLNILTSDDGSSWSVVSSTGENLTGIIYAGNQYTTVGDNGKIMTSDTGSSWTDRTSGISENLQGICRGNSFYLSVGTSGTAITSEDGISWTDQTSQTGTTDDLYGCDFSLGQHIVSGEQGTILMTEDGITWTPKSSGVANTLYKIIGRYP